MLRRARKGDEWLTASSLYFCFPPRCFSERSVRVTCLCADTAATAARIKAVGSAAGSNNRDHLHVSPLVRRDGRRDVNLFILLDWSYFSLMLKSSCLDVFICWETLAMGSNVDMLFVCFLYCWEGSKLWSNALIYCEILVRGISPRNHAR